MPLTYFPTFFRVSSSTVICSWSAYIFIRFCIFSSSVNGMVACFFLFESIVQFISIWVSYFVLLLALLIYRMFGGRLLDLGNCCDDWSRPLGNNWYVNVESNLLNLTVYAKSVLLIPTNPLVIIPSFFILFLSFLSDEVALESDR